MKATKLQLASATLLNPKAAQWKKVPVENIQLSGTPLHLQPALAALGFVVSTSGKVTERSSFRGVGGHPTRRGTPRRR